MLETAMNNLSSLSLLPLTRLSPTTLVATTVGDMVLAVSPLVPPMCLGMILSSCQERGYQFRGVKRVRLNSRRANALGRGFNEHTFTL